MRASHDSVLLELTHSICPVCRQLLDAEVHARDGKVYLRRECREHGEFEAIVYGDARRYLEIQRYNKPGERPLRLQTEAVEGCPHDCGICPEHKQHSCLGIIEVNTGCNLDCPICFADSGTGHQPDGYSLTLEQVERMLDAFVAAEGDPEAIQLSGGEPSIHPQILDMLAAAKARGIKLVMLNTNGIRLARDPRFAPALAEIGVHVYLQFDGFEDSTQLAIRGRRLQEEKLRALDRCAAAGLGVSRAAAVERGINDDEVGAIVRFGVEHPAVTGVFFQPVTHSGRFLEFDPRERLTNSDVIEAIARQLPEWFSGDDFVPVPCCSPTCRSATYALYDGHDLVPLPRLVDVDDYLDYVTNRAVPDLEIRTALEGLFSASAAGGTERTGERLECVACGVGLPTELQQVAAKGFIGRGAGLPGPVHARRAQAAQVLRRRDRPGRPADPLLRLQLGRLSRAGALPAVGRGQERSGVSAGPSLETLLGAELRSCCVSAYESEAVRWLLGDDLHPGGAALSRRLADLAGVGPGSQVLDVASGRGRTARLLASEFGAEVTGVELSGPCVAAAQAEAEAAELQGRVRFVQGDAAALPAASGATTPWCASARSVCFPTRGVPSQRCGACCGPAAPSRSLT
jgi:7,8-dihydro-6-hydroxymethylpterin dimethyltransferase